MTARRLFPQPAVSAAVFVTWLLAQNGLAVADVVAGSVLAFVVPLASARFWPEYPSRIHYAPLVRLAFRVAVDIVIATAKVAVLVVGPMRRIRPAFIEVPLAVESTHAITLLASVISLTPGTVSANLSGDRRTLLVHGLAIVDPASAIDRIKRRYERLIAEAFGC